MSWSFYDAVGRTKSIAAGPPVPMDTWHTVGAAGEPAFQNSFTPTGAEPVQFRKFPDGKVIMRGVANNASATIALTIFTLPVGYRPPRNYARIICSDGNTGSCYVYVQGDGQVVRYPGTVSADLSAVEFDTETVSQLAGGPAGQAPRVTALPTGATHGQECLYQAGTNGELWHLSYNALSASALKWEMVGGSPLFASAGTALNDETRAATAYGDLATVGPSATVPLAGDYLVDIRCFGYGNAVGNAGYMSYTVGATAASDSDSAFFAIANINNDIHGTSRITKKTLAAGDTLVAKYKVSSATTFAWRGARTMNITPIRVG